MINQDLIDRMKEIYSNGEQEINVVEDDFKELNKLKTQGYLSKYDIQNEKGEGTHQELSVKFYPTEKFNEL